MEMKSKRFCISTYKIVHPLYFQPWGMEQTWPEWPQLTGRNGRSSQQLLSRSKRAGHRRGKGHGKTFQSLQRRQGYKTEQRRNEWEISWSPWFEHESLRKITKPHSPIKKSGCFGCVFRQWDHFGSELTLQRQNRPLRTSILFGVSPGEPAGVG